MRRPVITRRLALASLLLASACSGPFIENPNMRSDEPGVPLQSVYTVAKAPIRTRDDRFLDIARIAVNDAGRSYGTDSSQGLTQIDQNRVRLNDIPLAGGLFLPRLREAEFSERNRVGTVFAAGDTAYVMLDVLNPRGPYRHVVLVNGNNAWAFPDLAPKPPPGPAPGGSPPVVGDAYARGGDTLLLLVRPSIITDSLL